MTVEETYLVLIQRLIVRIHANSKPLLVRYYMFDGISYLWMASDFSIRKLNPILYLQKILIFH